MVKVKTGKIIWNYINIIQESKLWKVTSINKRERKTITSIRNIEKEHIQKNKLRENVEIFWTPGSFCRVDSEQLANNSWEIVDITERKDVVHMEMFNL